MIGLLNADCAKNRNVNLLRGVFEMFRKSYRKNMLKARVSLMVRLRLVQ